MRSFAWCGNAYPGDEADDSRNRPGRSRRSLGSDLPGGRRAARLQAGTGFGTSADASRRVGIGRHAVWCLARGGR
jgi:hypothetical protein